MPLDASDKAELLALFRAAITAAPHEAGKGNGAAAPDAARVWPAPGADDEHIWLTTREAAAFLRMPPSTWYEFRRKHEQDLVISRPMQGATDPRYQLASLRRYMLAKRRGPARAAAGHGGPRHHPPNQRPAPGRPPGRLILRRATLP